MNPRSLVRLLVCWLGAIFMITAQASSAYAVTIILQAHVDAETEPGGTLTPGYNFTLILESTPTLLLPNANNDAESSAWTYNNGMGSPIWSNVSFSGQTGTWTDATDPAETISYLNVNRTSDLADFDSVLVVAGNAAGSGIFLNGKEVLLVTTPLVFDPGTLPKNPVPANGTIDRILPSGNFVLKNEASHGFLYLIGGEEIGFTVDSVTFVPEPSVSLLSACLFGLALTRRRRPAR